MLGRPRLEWPNGARIAFWIGVNVEYYQIEQPSFSVSPATAAAEPQTIEFSRREYGPRVGIWRLMRVLDKYGLRASVLLNSDVCHQYPQIIEEGNKRRWAWLGHGKTNSRKWTGMSMDEERAALAEVVGTIRERTGQPVRGWLGPALSETWNTPALLAEQGLTYLCDWPVDDQPYPMQVPSGRLIGMPYTSDLNDMSMFRGNTVDGPAYHDIVTSHFDVLYEEAAATGLVCCLPVHPFIINQPYRHKYLDQVLAYIAGHENVWLTTSDEIADWYYAHYYDQAVQAIGAS
jgi:peptidoglycan/xylan/chitin deacetylase (PgdA/CDA1 family)